LKAYKISAFKGEHILNEVSKNTSSQTKTKLWLDILIFIAFLAAMELRSSGLAIHEWLTLSTLSETSRFSSSTISVV